MTENDRVPPDAAGERNGAQGELSALGVPAAQEHR